MKISHNIAKEVCNGHGYRNINGVTSSIARHLRFTLSDGKNIKILIIIIQLSQLIRRTKEILSVI